MTIYDERLRWPLTTTAYEDRLRWKLHIDKKSVEEDASQFKKNKCDRRRTRSGPGSEEHVSGPLGSALRHLALLRRSLAMRND